MTRDVAAPTDAQRLLAAAWALPGLLPALAMPGDARAQAETEAQPQVTLRVLHYRDAQPGLDRIQVQAPAIAVQLPLAARWSLLATATQDSVSGASPRYHTSVSGASRMSDQRRGGDWRLTHHGERAGLTVGVATSDERDWHSRAVSLTTTRHTDDRNRSWQLGAAITLDRIGSVDDPELRERRRTFEATTGITQVLTPTDVVQFTLSHAAGAGFYNDPYKRLDERPRSRHQSTAVLRWNHHVDTGLAGGSTVRLSARQYQDSWAIRATTVTGEWVWPLGERWSLTPLVRLHTQSAARFYGDPVYSYLGAPYPPGWLESQPQHLSLDQRLSAFGARTLGGRVGWRASDHWNAELRVERYSQRAAWRWGGIGSPGLARFDARLWQWALTRRF